MIDYIIIGAGISGLNLAKNLVDLGLGNVLILEKSRGVGGRLATRRTLETRFDHGAQFYRLKSDITKLHQQWQNEKVCHQWFISFAGNHWCANDGMTSLAKSLAKNLKIELEKQVQHICFENNLWKLTSDKNEVWECRNLIITAPLPQAIILLEKSGLTVSDQLKNIIYSKALIGLITLKRDLNFSSNGYAEFTEGDFFSISDQAAKGVSQLPALSITMSEKFSEEQFESNDEVVLEKILNLFQQKYPEAEVLNGELKKWRYCRPISTYKNLFAEIGTCLYLSGDAFGGSSILGAIRSSNALTDQLIEIN